MRWTKQGAAIGYLEVSDLLTVVEPIVQDALRLDDLTPANRSEDERILSYAPHLMEWLLAHIHGTATPRTTPDLTKLKWGVTTFKANTAEILADAAAAGWVVDDGRGNPYYRGRSAAADESVEL